MNRAVRLNRLLTILALCASIAGCGSLPRDPEGTLQRVRGGRLRVGLVEHPPWVVRTSGEPAGAEVELVRQFAEQIGATPEWFWGGEQQHMEALKRFELDLVIGGLTNDTPWSKEVGLTSPYFEDRIVVGVPALMPPLKDVAGAKIAAKRGEVVAAYLEQKGAVPVRVDELSQEARGPVAAPDWQLEQLGLTRTNVKLYTEKHVMAVPPGENGWLTQLDDFLGKRRSQVKEALQREEARR